MARNTEYLNLNEQRRYPVGEDADVRAQEDPSVSLPNCVLLDFAFTFPAVTGDVPELKLHRIVYVGSTLTLIWTTSTGATLTTLAVDLNAHTARAGYTVAGVGDYSAGAGRAVIGDPVLIAQQLPQGAFTFDARMEYTTLIPSIREVNSISTDNAGQVSQPLFGHVRLLSGSNIRLTPLPDGNSIRIDALSGDGFEEDCDCDALVARPCIETVNGINVADLQLDGDDCLQVSIANGRIKFENPCAAPCCGCEELVALTAALQQLQETERRLNSYIAGLESRQMSLEQFLMVMVTPLIPPDITPPVCLSPSTFDGEGVLGGDGGIT